MSISTGGVSIALNQTERREVDQPSLAGKQCQYPALYQINTRVWLSDLSQDLGRPATFDDIPEQQFERLAEKGIDWIWFLGVWQTGLAGQRISREHVDWQTEFRHELADFRDEDVCGSCFAITQYAAHSDFGGSCALERLQRRLHKHGLRLLLDFVPNHTALDHPWVTKHPNFYIPGTEEDLRREPQNYIRIETSNGPTILAYGRDPYFSGWSDTLQLNYAEPALREAMRLELLNVAAFCDGVRCDMAMLILPEVFERTWGLQTEPFWPNAILAVRSYKPRFLFMAEVYWDLEWALQQQGFEYTYDKRLYDRLREGKARPVRDHFQANIQFQQKSVRFLENHDEPRAATAFAPGMHRAAAMLTYLCPGLRFFHDGQFEGKTKRLSMHLGRGSMEAVELPVRDFYDRLLAAIHQTTVRNGEWQLLLCSPAWEGNWTWDSFICFQWDAVGELPLIVVTNYAPIQSQCYVRIPFDALCGHRMRLQDLMSSAIYERDGDELVSRGLYLDMPPWGYHLFQVMTVEGAS